MGINFMDQYSLLHFAVGIIVYFWGVSLPNWFIMHTLFELLENSNIGINIINTLFKDVWPGGKDYADSTLNTIGDGVFAILGWLFAWYVDYYGSKLGLYPIHIKN